MIRTIFCVQPYQKAGNRLEKGHMRRLLSRDAAIRAARAYRGSAAGVVVFRVSGYPEADVWSEPQVIALSGEVPSDDR